MKKIFLILIVLILEPIVLLSQNFPIVKEAEEALLGADYEIVEEGTLSFVRPTTDYAAADAPGNASKMISFSVQFDAPGKYEFYAKIRVGAEGYNDDSFFLSTIFGESDPEDAASWHLVNGLVPVGHNLADEFVTGAGNVGELSWKWLNISAFIDGANPVTFQVEDTISPMVFCIGAREDGLDIDKIAFGRADYAFTVDNLELVEEGTKDSNAGSTEISDEAFSKVQTFINPIMPGDHPDLTLFKDGDDFYSCGSNFHFTPYLPILHSTDLVHWEEICRVVPSDWSGLVSDAPQAGTWAGVITYFYGSYWIYFSNTAGGGQYFCKADHPAGPWSLPVKVKTTSTTGPIGYDNSVFVDDDGTPYMLIKPGQHVNRIQEINEEGHLKGDALILDWVNSDNQYSWAEGPVMCKRDGWYYYFIAGNVYGGQYVLRSQSLTDDPNSWEALGDFFESVTDPAVSFRNPNHIGQPFQLDDGTWWTISHSYESVGGNDWNGQGRQGMLHQIYWDVNGKPTGRAPSTTPQLKPDLPKSGISWKLPISDYFEKEEIQLSWHFMNKRAASKYSLNAKPGWLTLQPGFGKTHILHKEARHHYALITKLDVDASSNGEEAGIYLTNGNESVTVEVYSGYNDGKVLGYRFGNTKFEQENTLGNELWLKVERIEHYLTAFYSTNGIRWHQLGNRFSVSNLDKGQENYNWWVGTSNGLYAAKTESHFDLYAFKDGFSSLPVIAYNNYFGVEAIGSGTNKGLTNTSEKGGWVMLGGVDLGTGERVPESVQIEAAATTGGTLEVWIDDLQFDGMLITTIDVTPTGGLTSWQSFSAVLGELQGQHDIFLKWNGPANAFVVKSIQFVPDASFFTSIENHNETNHLKVYPNPFSSTFFIKGGVIGEKYSICNLEGKVIEEGIIGSDNQAVGSVLRPGMYLLKHHSSRIKLNKLD